MSEDSQRDHARPLEAHSVAHADRPVAAPRRRLPVVLGLAGLVAVAVAVAAVLLSRPDVPGSDVVLAMDLEEGKTYRYRMTISMDVAIEPFSAKRFRSEVSQVTSWRVVSRDTDGTMTVEVRGEDVTATVDGGTVSVPAPPPLDTRLVIAADGRLVDAGDLEALFSAGSQQPMPGVNQFLPVLPERPVGPGDSWERDFSTPVPFTDEAGVSHAQSRFVGYEEMRGVQAAVIDSAITSPATEFTLDAGDVADLEGLTGSSGGGELVPQGFEMTYRMGPMRFEQTSWMDPGAGELLRSEVEGSIDMRASFEGLPSDAELGEFSQMRITGDMAMTMERL